MLTVIHCINSVSSAGGGPSFVLKELLNSVEGVRHEVLSLLDRQPSTLPTDTNLRLFKRSGPFAFSYSRSFEKALHQRVGEVPDAIVHVHGLWSGQTFAINRVRRDHPGMNIVVSPHGMLSPAALARRELTKAMLLRLAEQPLFTAARRIHALTLREQQDIERKFGALAVQVIPNLYQFNMDHDDLASLWKRRSTQPKSLVYVGRIHETKGIFELVAACRHRLDRNAAIDGRVIIAGFGDDAEVRRLKAEVAGLHPHVEYVGPVFGAEKQALLESAHAMILPSQTEGFPVSLLEGAAAALPLFVTRECNFNWVAGIDPRCEVSYGISGIAALLDSFCAMSMEELRTSAMKTYEFARSQFDARVVARAWTHFYRLAGAGADGNVNASQARNES